MVTRQKSSPGPRQRRPRFREPSISSCEEDAAGTVKAVPTLPVQRARSAPAGTSALRMSSACSGGSDCKRCKAWFSFSSSNWIASNPIVARLQIAGGVLAMTALSFCTAYFKTDLRIAAAVMSVQAIIVVWCCAMHVTQAREVVARARLRSLESPFQTVGRDTSVDETIIDYLQRNYDSPNVMEVLNDHLSPPTMEHIRSGRSDDSSRCVATRKRSRSDVSSNASRGRTSSIHEYMSIGSRKGVDIFTAFEEDQKITNDTCAYEQMGESPSSAIVVAMSDEHVLDDSRDRSDDIPSKLAELASRLSYWDFDMFEVAELTSRPLSFIGFMCLDAYSGLVDIDKPRLVEFLNDVENSYRSVPYHNSLHGASVARSVYSFCTGCGLSFTRENMEFTLVLAALVHDVHHPGLTSTFLSKADTGQPWQTPVTPPLEEADMSLVLKYNDQSPLEHMHCSVTFELLRRQKNAFLSQDDIAAMRKPLIRAILGTDMAKHAETMTRLVALIDNMRQGAETDGTGIPWYWPVKPPANSDAQQMEIWETNLQEEFVMELFLHAADIGNPALPFGQWKRWNALVQQEFHEQGDREKVEFGCLISPPAGFDRDAGARAMHIFTKGFMQHVALPFFERLVELTEVASASCVAEGVDISKCLTNLKRNLELWDEYIPPEEDADASEQ